MSALRAILHAVTGDRSRKKRNKQPPPSPSTGDSVVRRSPERSIRRIHETDHPIDDAIAIDRLNLVRYCASGLVAGGAGVTLTMMLTGLTVQPQSVVALRVLGTLLLAGGLAFVRRAVIWMGIAVPRKLTAYTAAILLYQLVSATIFRPEHAARGFSGEWWQLLGQAAFTTFIGAALRYWAEMEIDDLQYGFDHGLSTVQTGGTHGE